MGLSNGNVDGEVTSPCGEATSAAIVAATVVDVVTIRGDVAMELGQAMHEMAAGQLDPDEFHHRFLAARIYTLCPVRPGLFVMSLPGGAAIVPVWTTIRALQQVMGSYDWCSRSGEDLVAHLPPGVGVLVDAGMPHSVTMASMARNSCASVRLDLSQVGQVGAVGQVGQVGQVS